MSWLKNIIPPKIKRIVGRVKNNIPEGLWHKCPICQTALYKTDLEKSTNANGVKYNHDIGIVANIININTGNNRLIRLS